MSKIITNLILLVFLILILFVTILSTRGIETEKFNNLISQKINETNNNVNLKLTSIKFKLDIKEISLFLETINPKIDYRGSIIPAKNIKVYVGFISIIKTEPKIKKINLVLEQFDIQKLKKLSATFKPSNFTSFINNKVIKGRLNLELDVYLNDRNLFEDFIAKGSVTNLKTEIIDNINLDKINFTFFLDKTDALIKNFSGESGPIKINNGDLKLKFSPEILIDTNFATNIKYNNNFTNFKNLINKISHTKNIISFEADLDNSFSVNLDKTYKIRKYDHKSKGKISKAYFKFKKPLKNNLLDKDIDQLLLENSEFRANFNSKNNNTNMSGKYSLNQGNKLLYSFNNTINGELFKLKLDAEYDQPIDFELINYEKPKNSIANISINLVKQKDNLRIKNINFTEKDNSFLIEDMKFTKDKFISLKKISVKTNKYGKINNDFSIAYGKDILIKGTRFDANKLAKILNQETSKNKFTNINKNIEIDFTNILAPLSKDLANFRLIGKIEKGKFSKISSKGSFGENKFLDIKMEKNNKNQKKYLEIYSDLAGPLLSELNFFKGLSGGNLLYTSVIEDNSSTSKLKIENFKVKDAPGMIKLLSLADLGGLADLAKGEGLSFDVLEITLEKNNDILKLNEILALGPSVSVLMEGYQDKNGITSLRGTLVPAKSLNSLISRIPVLGDIIIPKEVGEGLFGISFKMKGPKGKIKTTINPIRTVTPRFIQKIIDRNKKSK